MAIKKINCESCGTQISQKAITCPSCGHPNKDSQNLSGGQVIMGLAVAFCVIYYLANGGTMPFTMQEIHDKVSDDTVKQYELVSKNGTAVDKCVHAGIVAAAYLQAQDAANYQQWNSIKAADCKKAGVPY
jgi:uncharacterized paraquat-inducible protein A